MASRQHPSMDPDPTPTTAEVGQRSDVYASTLKRWHHEAGPDV